MPELFHSSWDPPHGTKVIHQDIQNFTGGHAL